MRGPVAEIHLVAGDLAADFAMESDGVTGDQEAHELSLFSPDGSLERILRWAGPSLELDRSEVDEWRALQVGSAPSDRREEVRAWLSDVPMPRRRPAYRDVLVDEEGVLWVEAYAHPSETAEQWDVFRPDGQWLASVRMPPRFRPHHIGAGWILGVARDALGAERVELRWLRR